MPTYRKKPVEIEAVLFTDETKDQVYNWATSIQGNVRHDWSNEGNPILIIPTNEGDMVCSIGDYLIKEPHPTNDRRLYPCKPDIFRNTYEIAVFQF